MSQETLQLKIAEREDEEAVIELIKEVYNYSGYSSVEGISERHLRDTFQRYLESDKTDLCVFLLKDQSRYAGILVSLIQPSLLDPRNKTAAEIVFWVREQYKSGDGAKQLLRAYKHWSKLVGASSYSIGRIGNKGGFEEMYLRRIT